MGAFALSWENVTIHASGNNRKQVGTPEDAVFGAVASKILLIKKVKK